MQTLARTQLGEIVVSHYQSLPYDRTGSRNSPWPWIVTFLVGPLVAAVALAAVGFAPAGNAAIGLIAGVGVLGGLLFQVLAWISGRIGALADQANTDAPDQNEVQLIARLDMARTNIAYATMISVGFVVELGVVALLQSPPNWLAAASAFLLFHFAATLILVIVRINAIGRTDRVAALTRHALKRSTDRV
jgi:hypothetical protein